MLEIRLHRAPVACVVVEGKAISATPGMLERLSNAIAAKGVNILAVSSGDTDLGFFVDEADAELVRHTVAQKALRLRGIRDISAVRGMGMMTVKGERAVDSQAALGLVYKVLHNAGIVPNTFVAGGNSIRLFFSFKRCGDAFAVLDRNMAQLAEIA